MRVRREAQVWNAFARLELSLSGIRNETNAASVSIIMPRRFPPKLDITITDMLALVANLPAGAMVAGEDA